MKLIVYLDIDGTLLYEPEGDDFPETLDGQLVCDGLEPLLGFVTEHCEPYWLSYRARLGRQDIMESRIYPHMPEVARKIDIAHWNHFKHEGLATERSFLWFDDYLEPEDEKWLHENSLRNSLIMVEGNRPDNPVIMLETLQRYLQQ